jgi:DnaJ-class molecular chaperone
VSLAGIPGASAEPIEVEIPAGVSSGETISVPAAAPGAPGGRIRVLLRVEVEPHPLFRREGAHVHTTLDMRLGEALIGRTVHVPTVDGMAMLSVPPLTLNGDVLRMRGKGVQDPHGRGRGDQLVHMRCAFALICFFWFFLHCGCVGFHLQIHSVSCLSPYTHTCYVPPPQKKHAA